MTEQLLELPLDRVHPREDQPRQHFDEGELIRLAQSLDADGQVVRAVVRPSPTRPGHYELVAGERRYRALREHARTKVLKVVVVEGHDDITAYRLSFLENENRVDLHPLEKAHAMRKLLSEGLTQRDLARMMGKDDMYVSTHLSLLRLVPEVQALMGPERPDRQRLGFVAAVAISRTPPELQLSLAELATKRGTRVNDVKTHIEELLDSNLQIQSLGAKRRKRQGHATLKRQLGLLVEFLRRRFQTHDQLVDVYHRYGHVSVAEIDQVLGSIHRLREQLAFVERGLRAVRGLRARPAKPESPSRSST